VVIRLLGLVAVLLANTATGAAAAERFIPLMQAGDAIPPIPLIAQDGRSFTFADLQGNAVAVAFIYTRCRDPRMCPLVAAKFARAQATIRAAPVRLVLLTLDPGYDTPRVLARYGRGFGQDPRYWTLATGSQAALQELAARFGIATSGTAPGSIVHTEAAILIGPDGRVARTIDGNEWTPGELIDAARATLPAQANAAIGLRAWLSAAMERCGTGGIALSGSSMLLILGFAGLLVGGVFWRAFRGPSAANGPAPPPQIGG
jgi:cytochrome oxidase Cu insertion factor (SCO1/SenC/PrrC family)